MTLTSSLYNEIGIYSSHKHHVCQIKVFAAGSVLLSLSVCKNEVG